MLDFNKRLKTLRKEKRRTQEDVAKFLDIKRATYSGYERGVIMPPYDKIKKLADYFGVSVEYLMKTNNFQTHEDNLPDISHDLQSILEDLQNQQKALMFDGKALDDESRELLKSSLENSIKMALLLSKNK